MQKRTPSKKQTTPKLANARSPHVLNPTAWRPIVQLQPQPRNARTHSERQLTQLMASIQEFGFVNPVLIDEKGGILAGHGRVEAARRLGMREVPTLRIDHLGPTQKRAYLIADNRLGELAGWDPELLRIELQELSQVEFLVEVTGFSTAEIDLMTEEPEELRRLDPDDAPEPIAPGPAISRAGDLWELGRHRLLCGDALSPVSYAALLGTETAEMVFTDPPYNVRIEGHVSGTGRHREFAMAAGEMSRAEFTRFLTAVLHLLARHSGDGSIHFVCMDWRHLGELLAAGDAAYTELKNLCVWGKTNAGMGSFYRSQHELVFVFKNGRGPHINNFGLGQGGRYRTNLWTYAGANSLQGARGKEDAIHPTIKPVAMVADAIRDCSKRNGIVLDPFCGSGTILLAAERTGRSARAIELDPLYVDAALRRWEARTGGTVRLAGTGQHLAEVAAERMAQIDAEAGQ